MVFTFVLSQALEKYNVEKDIAAYLKKEFDRKHGTTWHAIVGRNFGSYVTHEAGYFIYFYVGQVKCFIVNSRERFRDVFARNRRWRYCFSRLVESAGGADIDKGAIEHNLYKSTLRWQKIRT